MTAAHEPGHVSADTRPSAAPPVAERAGSARPAALPDVPAALRARLHVPGPATLSALVLLAVLLWLPPGLRLLVLAWVGGVAGAAALPFGVVGLAARLCDRGLGPR